MCAELAEPGPRGGVDLGDLADSPALDDLFRLLPMRAILLLMRDDDLDAGIAAEGADAVRLGQFGGHRLLEGDDLDPMLDAEFYQREPDVGERGEAKDSGL